MADNTSLPLPMLLSDLANLNRVAAEVNATFGRVSAGHSADLTDTLRLIAAGAVELMVGGTTPAGREGRATAVIYTCKAGGESFVADSRVAAGDMAASSLDAAPRANGLGVRALRQRQRLLSYDAQGPEMHPAMKAAGARMGVCYPLIVAEQPVGALYVYLHEDRRFTELELLLLDNFVNLAAMAIHRVQQLARIQKNLERKEDELERLRRADLLISSRSRLDETLEAILQMALEVTGARYGILRLVDESGKHLAARALAGDDLGRPAVEALPINATSITGWVAKTLEPLCITDVRSDPWARIYYPLDHEREMRSELAVPLIGASGRLEGVINLESPLVAAFSEDDSLLLQSLATQAVIAIQEVRLLDALQEIAERLLMQPARQVFDRLVELACELLGVPVCALWTLEGADLVVQSATAGHQPGDRLPVQGSLTGDAINQRVLVFSSDVRADPRFLRPDLAAQHNWTQALIVPLLTSEGRSETPYGEAVGALSVYNTTAGASQFAASDWDKKVLTFLAHNAALAVQNAARQEALRLAREQQAAAETFAVVGDIAANLLHRLNNKIGTIPVRVEGIQDKRQAVLAADEYLARNLGEIGRSAVEAMEVVRESLYFMRSHDLSPVNIAAAIADAIIESGLPPDMQISTAGLGDLPPVQAGHRRLALVFANLLENAAAAMEGKGQVRIVGQRRNGWIEIAVSDTGPGIPPALHERIFEFNYSGAKRASGKLGFGLWWVKTLMARFGGTIVVESDGRHGATFRLRLPVEMKVTMDD